MKTDEAKMLTTEQLSRARQLGARFRRLRLARNLRQADAAIRAGLSRPTARKIEQGDPSRTVGQLLRYLEAIAPGSTLVQLLEGTDPALKALEESEQRKRVRGLSRDELEKLDF